MYMVVEWTSGGLPWRKYKADNREEVLKMKEEVRDSAEAMGIFFRNCPEREFKRILKYLYELTYFSIPDYNFVYYCIQHACKANNIKPTDPLDWDMSHKFAGPTGPPGDGKMSGITIDDGEEYLGYSKHHHVGSNSACDKIKNTSLRKTNQKQRSFRKTSLQEAR
ncbi:hypothetical protein DICVIV_01242 [Dictyocaulus viviparus]|uniref:Uncharacterized protein n=1 Tax=Dictyocaulus viviparus TaxID=29172 RepID=A0A0D8Y8J7_DICVI|nr:hypothetical protein DICVIV_01242 [Dictyocaulus viviparus]